LSVTAAPDAFLGVERSLGGRLWQARPGDERVALALAQRLGVPDVVGRVLASRGVDLAGADAFLAPTLRSQLPDPSHLRDMDRAAARLAAAIRGGEEVAVFGDYDVDGATSSALLKRFFDAVGGRLRVYIPDRMREGYGPNAPALRRLAGDGVRLVVTVDCGTTAFEALAAGLDAGLEIVVVDHHQAEPQLPSGCLVVNPNRLDEASPHGNLAAVGLTFLLVVAVNRVLREAGHYGAGRGPDLLQWLDLVALGTVCDVVSLKGLNRVLVAQGLKVLAERRNPGLRALADVAGMDARPGAFHLGYVLGPRINAGGRVGQADLGARLLTATDEAEAVAIAQTLDDLNAERRAIETTVLEGAMLAAEAKREAALLLVAGGHWHEGVIGIVAGRLKDRFRKPAFVLSVTDGVAKGSGRSVPGVDLGAAVTAARQAGLLLNGGGHAMAAGLTVAEDRIAALEAFLLARVGPALAGGNRADTLNLDGALAIGGATRELFNLLERAGPYGAGHPEPRFAMAGVRIARADVVGGEHVRVILSGAAGGRLKGIAFRSVDATLGRSLLQSGGRPMHLAGRLRADDWQGRNDVQFVIEDAAHPGAAM
jgi:single-stranded-DNA-specific exonuclease